jgi:predicted lipid-binding transport protein (Tim44 family)
MKKPSTANRRMKCTGGLCRECADWRPLRQRPAVALPRRSRISSNRRQQSPPTAGRKRWIGGMLGGLFGGSSKRDSPFRRW